MASALRKLAPGLWVAECSFRNGPFEFGLRMSVIQLRDGGLVLHSPVRLRPELRAELDALGPVRGVIAPSRAHHLFASDYPTGYPDALLFAAPGLPEKRPDLKFAAELSDEAPPLWRSELEQHVFRGAPIMNEVVFFHPASRTVLFTDLVFNLPAGAGNWASRIFFRAVGADRRFGPHRLVRYLFIRDRAKARESLQRILAWDFDRVTLTHGDVLETGGHEAVRRAFAFLG
ncbi:MAG TPA: DUF4336 domain-containing protein [Myxococcota bacterium]|nr:DUF4336 domain-containing protein [Myxococcota bacterium]